MMNMNISKKSSLHSSPELHQLQRAVEERERVISKLENQVEEQKKLRMEDAKQVEAKAAKIKEWVASKLQELEEQNELLRGENQKYNERLIILQQRLKHASPETRRKIESTISALNTSSSAEKYSYSSGAGAYSVINKGHKPNYQYSRLLKETSFDDNLHFSSSDDDGEMEMRNNSGSCKYKPKTGKPVPPPRTRLPLNIDNYVNMPGTPQFSKRTSRDDSGTSLMYSRGGSLDRKLADIRKLNFSELRERRKLLLATAADDHHDYSEIYTPSDERKAFCEERPPTPPMHRCPSWESRIYKIASTGISSATTTPTHSIKSVKKLNLLNVSDSKTQDTFYDLSVPVFASIQGRASQIRSVPFSGESSDSSENETEDRATTTRTTSSTSADGSEEYSTPIHRVRRGISIESALSDDYALPPDAMTTATSHDILANIDMEPKVPKRFSSLQRETGNPFKQELLEKCGYLTKLGGRLKTWKRRWFVLKDDKLSYYRSQSDAVRGKAKRFIPLDNNTHITRTDGSATFQISTSQAKNVHYLTAESVLVMEEWVRLLQATVKKNIKNTIDREKAKPTIEGWLTKVKHGRAKKCWCVLIGRTFAYYKQPSDTNPIGQINLRKAKVEEVLQASDSDTEDYESTTTYDVANTDTGVSTVANSSFTIAIHPESGDTNPIYLILSNRQEMDSWLYHLTVVSDSDSVTGTQFEHIVAKLMQSDSPENSPGIIDNNPLWNDPVLQYTKESITHPLTTLPSEHLRNEAIKLFKSLQLFISVALDSAGIDYHVSLVQNSLHLCISHPELQNEIFCQLIKQTCYTPQKLCGSAGVHQLLLCATQTFFSCDSGPSGSEKTSPTANSASLSSYLSFGDPSNHVFIQAFQFLSLAISLFLPKGRILWLLKQHLRRCSDPKSEVGKYAIYCQRALERSLQNGMRECKPSRMEILGILLRNPYHHSLPHSIPVHFVNDTYMVVGFDGSTTVEEFTQLLNTQAAIRPSNQSGFALYSDDPIDKLSEHLLQSNSKLADVISRWESALREKHFGKFENTRVLRLLYKNRLYFKSLTKSETDKEKILLVYQLNQDVRDGRFPVTQELALELTALLAQIEFGDIEHNMEEEVLKKTIEKFYPSHFKIDILVVQELLEKWRELLTISRIDCARIYLNCARKWQFCGAKLFEAKPVKPIKTETYSSKLVILPSSSSIWLAVNEDSVALLDYESLQLIVQYHFSVILTFGGCKNDFMLVISRLRSSDSGSASGSANGSVDSGSLRSERLLFAMPKAKILEITYLIADYINGRNMMCTTTTSDKLTLDRRTLEKMSNTPNKLTNKSTPVKTPSLTRSHTRL